MQDMYNFLKVKSLHGHNIYLDVYIKLFKMYVKNQSHNLFRKVLHSLQKIFEKV